MAEFAHVTLLYTANLQGELALLPRLFTLIEQERRAAQGPVFLLDLGDSCALSAWACQATHGRAPFLVFDSMGYDAALIGGPERVPIPPDALRRLVAHLVMPIAVWNRARTLQKHGVTLTLAPGNAPAPPNTPCVRVDRSRPTLPPIGERVALLGDVPQGELARVTMSWPAWQVQATARRALRPQTPPHPSIAAVVELVEEEARAYSQREDTTP